MNAPHRASPEDQAFVRAFEACQVAPEAFDHAFVALNPRLLNSKIMLKHYSAEVLFSPQAREEFIQPDVRPIPRH